MHYKMLPDDFWVQFDKRLEQKIEEILDRVLDRKFDEKLKGIKDNIQTLKNWTHRQDTCIETEMSRAVFSHLEKNFTGYYCFYPQILGKYIKYSNGTVLTEMDGVVCLTNDKKFMRYMSGEINKNDWAYDRFSKSYIIIVESKQHLTRNKTSQKLAQRSRIADMIDTCGSSALPQRIKDIFQGVEKEVGLYIGGQVVDDGAKTLIDDFFTAKSQNPLCGIIELNGARFAVNDASNDFGKFAFLGGGMKSKNDQNVIKERTKRVDCE